MERELNIGNEVGRSTNQEVAKMMRRRQKVEREQNTGNEAGCSKNQEVAKVNPKLAAMNKKFGMIQALNNLPNLGLPPRHSASDFGSFAKESMDTAIRASCALDNSSMRLFKLWVLRSGPIVNSWVLIYLSIFNWLLNSGFSSE
ncbi:hypothetical protein GH714_022748 [Hevea brasiliensis]|uniref:Uncharacterized protein n=1 Tax=Hevea brasiliensis TaxID=3981 RepID=A0A6A6NIS5_HEVBR|nr:hypothetical protein GH714_022748 [Hevea brasiliensis]